MDDFCGAGDVKDYLGVTNSTDDPLFARLAAAATAWIRSYLTRDVSLNSYVEQVDGTGARSISLKNYPILGVASVTTGQPGMALQTLTQGTDYIYSGRQIKFVTDLPPRGPGTIVVSYTAGYEAVPWDIQQAAITIAALYYKRKSRLGEVSKIVGGETISFSQKDVPDDVKTSLDQWKSMVPV